MVPSRLFQSKLQLRKLLIFAKTYSTSKPLSLTGWNFEESRASNGICIGNALLDGDYRTSWEYFGVPQRLALFSSLAYVKGGIENLPRGSSFHGSADGMILKHLIVDVCAESKVLAGNLNTNNGITHTVFDQHYDVICPIPSSKGPASIPNLEVAKAVSFGLSGSAGPPSEMLVRRVKPMTTKSTKTAKETRRHMDAPKMMHFDNMSLEPALYKDIQGKKILLYDDVMTWGNTTEAARNLLLLAGAGRVDVVTVFSTGPMMRASTYSLINLYSPQDLQEILCSNSPDKDLFRLEKSVPVSKEILSWTDHQPSMKIWHEKLGIWIEKNWPSFVPNDIPF